jgi:hypothetical protein
MSLSSYSYILHMAAATGNGCGLHVSVVEICYARLP